MAFESVTTKVIKTEVEYVDALKALDSLLELDPRPGTPDADRLEVLAVLLQNYEASAFPLAPPNPIDAIRFRMEQQNLSARDLIPMIGSRSKVSEVLAGRRPLTLSMIRALHKGLRIPLRALVATETATAEESQDTDWARFPVREMARRRWLDVAPGAALEESAETLMRRFFAPLSYRRPLYAQHLKTDRHIRSNRTLDRYALAAWTAQILIRASKRALPQRYTSGAVTSEFIRELAQLSWHSRGPVLAQDLLAQRGICLVVEPHLPGTYLDGAALLLTKDRPVIAMTLRHDRIDNFWYCLMHELGHICLHLKDIEDSFFDDLDTDSRNARHEGEADEFARTSLIPNDEWRRSPASKVRSKDAAEHLAQKLRIHPAIVVGRMRHMYKNYRILNHLVGRGGVKHLFEEAGYL